jgi:pimeloyl-ACP methyl ester carboxylesterase
LGELAATDPVAALVQLHEKAVATGERDQLLALSELSYVAAEHLRHSVRRGEPARASDFYLGATVYAFLFLFGDANGEKPGAFDRRFRMACDFYNYGLSRALMGPGDTNGVVRLEGGRRRLPVGEMTVSFNSLAFPFDLEKFDKFLAADHFKVRGLSVRNREAGVGAPLIAVNQPDPELRLRRSAPATAFLRVEGSLADLAAGKGSGTLELYSAFGENTVGIGTNQVPLEMDLTAPRAYTLNQNAVWKVGWFLFFSADRAAKQQLIPTEPHKTGRIPVVLVHGTFSSPVPWAEMLNTLYADPVLRQRCEIWLYMYSSSKPLVISAAEFRDELTAMVQKLDPEGKDAALRQMVIIGHSQGGLMAKMTATDSEDQLWRVFNDKSLEELHLSAEKEAEIRRLVYLKPLPFVRRTVFISTPHRGSYQNRSFVRKWGLRLVTLPRSVVKTTSDLLHHTEGIKLPPEFRGSGVTSLDGMAVNNPLMLKLADIPTAPGVTCHSIVAVKGSGDYHTGKDGIVAYSSAHVDYTTSEFIVRSGHSCQTQPSTIEEVRRILHEHLGSLQSVPPAQPAK